MIFSSLCCKGNRCLRLKSQPLFETSWCSEGVVLDVVYYVPGLFHHKKRHGRGDRVEGGMYSTLVEINFFPSVFSKLYLWRSCRIDIQDKMQMHEC